MGRTLAYEYDHYFLQSSEGVPLHCAIAAPGMNVLDRLAAEEVALGQIFPVRDVYAALDSSQEANLASEALVCWVVLGSAP